MSETAHPRKTRPKAAQPATAARRAPPKATPPPAPAGDAATPVERLTPEEQMERFARELKNEDWGHQPC